MECNEISFFNQNQCWNKTKIKVYQNFKICYVNGAIRPKVNFLAMIQR